ncbi:MAG: DUF4493 domain-containing protein [Bacteroidales bacterium]|nr:DUF4493 domain-containing protein [Bacteroidales bacterium]
MNRRLIYAVAATLMAVACTTEWDSGCVLFLLEEGEVTEHTKGTVRDYAELPHLDSLSLTIKDSSLKRIFNGGLSDWNPDTKMTPGDYSASVSYGDPSAEGPGAACFAGYADFTIKAGELTTAIVDVRLGNSIVKIETTETFRNYFPASCFTISTPLNPQGFIYDGTAVFVSGAFSVKGTVKSQNGTESALEEKAWRGEPSTCYTVKYDVTNAGGLAIHVSFDNTVQTVELGEISLN